MFWYGHSFELLSGEGFITPGANNNLWEIGKRLVSLPQLPGGRSGFGFDGPGLVQLLNRMMGKNIPRYCQQQVELGNTINFMTEVKEGDLVKEVNRGKISDVKEFKQALEASDKGNDILLLIRRGMHTRFVIIKSDSK